MAEDNTFSHLVVIGASAGGIEALTKLVSTLPEDLPAPKVIAQHLDPERASHLEQILSRSSTLPVRTITDNAPLEAGVIFVVPSSRHVSITDSHIGLNRDRHGRPMPSVDLLFTSASASFSERLIAKSMHERTALAGAKLEISPAPNRGTKVMVSVPLQES